MTETVHAIEWALLYHFLRGVKEASVASNARIKPILRQIDDFTDKNMNSNIEY